MLADSQYDIKINGGGFVLIEESYRRQPQQPFSARFATGDPGYGDLSFWQFQGMKDFDGGQGQEIFQTLSKLKGTVGWDLTDGKPRLSLGKGVYGSRSGTDVSAPNAPPDFGGGSASVQKQRQKTVRFGNNGTNDVLVLISPGSAASATQLDRVALAISEPYFYQTSAKDGVVWSRPKIGTFLVTCNAGTLYIYRISSGTNPIATIATVTLTAANAISLVPINGESIAILHQAAAIGSAAYISVVTFTTNTWTIATEATTEIGNVGNFVYGVSAVDSNGAAYFLSMPYILNTTGQPNLDSKVFACSASDLLHANGPRVTQVYALSNMVAGGLCAIAGVIYVLGAVRKDSSIQRQTIVRVSDRSIVWESPRSYLSDDGDNIIFHYFQDHPSEVFFLGRNYLLNYDSLYRMRDGGKVDEVWAVPKAANSAVDNYFPSNFNNRYYYVSRSAAKIYSSLDSRGALDASGTEAILETSRLTGNTDLIEKTPYSVIIKISTAMTGSDVLTVKINDTTIGTIAAADGTRKEITVSSDLTAVGFNVKVVAARAVTWGGYIEGIFLKYVPTQFKKKQWAFGLRLTNDLKLADGRRETRTPAEMAAEIEAAWASNIPVTLTDIDGVDYSVIITSYDIRRPLLARDKWKQEGLAFVEALQV